MSRLRWPVCSTSSIQGDLDSVLRVKALQGWLTAVAEPCLRNPPESRTCLRTILLVTATSYPCAIGIRLRMGARMSAPAKPRRPRLTGVRFRGIRSTGAARVEWLRASSSVSEEPGIGKRTRVQALNVPRARPWADHRGCVALHAQRQGSLQIGWQRSPGPMLSRCRSADSEPHG